LACIATAHLDLAGGLHAPREARQAIDNDIRRVIDEQEHDTLNLLVTELVANAVVHTAEGTATVRVAVDSDRIRAEVRDRGPGFDPQKLAPPKASGGGFGLVLVDRSASRWGVCNEDETCVWFELDRRRN
jgi:anti-sigma regulatory factor (Ser/Thr protein kinase)